jgi:hypothetical protein
MNKPFNSRPPLKNITREEAMGQMEGGQDVLMSYPFTPDESVAELWQPTHGLRWKRIGMYAHELQQLWVSDTGKEEWKKLNLWIDYESTTKFN